MGWEAEKQGSSLALELSKSQQPAGRLAFPQISRLKAALLKVTLPQPGNFGFKNHLDLIFYRAHGRLSNFNLSLSFNTLGVGHLLTYPTKLHKASA